MGGPARRIRNHERVLEVRAVGSRRGFSELGNEMKLTKRSLILLGARAWSRANQSRARRPRPPAARNLRAITSRASTRRMSSLRALLDAKFERAETRDLPPSEIKQQRKSPLEDVGVHTVNRRASQFLTKADSLKRLSAACLTSACRSFWHPYVKPPHV
jgi:hypothetical protein